MSSFNYKDLIRDKKEGKQLTKEQIFAWVEGVTHKTMPEYQLSALLMAIYFKGMTIEERGYLTQAMASSGKIMNYRDIPGRKVDKHSSGGIGDKTSIILVPLMMELGIKIPMVSGRGLGHTGGTVDKLESIPGFLVGLSFEKMKEMMQSIGCFMASQTTDIAPADKTIYGMRDVTETVDEISLITASILSKKFTEDLDALVMDVKCGPSAFMRTIEQATELADSIKRTCESTGTQCRACITRMDFPLGEHIGNANEIYECIIAFDPKSEYCNSVRRLQYCKNTPGLVKFENGVQSAVDVLVIITFVLALQMYLVSGLESDELKSFEAVKNAWLGGNLHKHFDQLCSLQSGSLDKFLAHYKLIQEQLDKPEQSGKVITVTAPKDGKLVKVDGVAIGNLMVDLNAGRKVFGEPINHDVSMQWYPYPNQHIKKGEVICKIYHPDFIKKDDHTFTFKAEQHFCQTVTKRVHDTLIYSEDPNYTYSEPLVYKVL
ncbi:hypothetical protein ABPG72_000687 [Tetrahymena utriculariae]